MNRSKLGLKALGLCALVMGVMAIGTSGVAQAEVGACWGYINPANQELKCFGAGLEPGVKFEFENKTGTLLIENLNFEVLCTGGELIEGGKLTSNGSITLGRVKFVGCIGLSRTPTLTKLAACTPKDPVGGTGTIITEKATGLIKLHEGEPTVVLTPDTPETLAKIHMSEECSVGEELIVKGQLVIHDCENKVGFETHKLVHLSEEFTKLQLMKVGVNKATIDGSANFSLTSPHNELKWAGKPF